MKRPFTFYAHHPICHANRGMICGIAAAASTDDVNRYDTTPVDGKRTETTAKNIGIENYYSIFYIYKKIKDQ